MHIFKSLKNVLSHFRHKIPSDTFSDAEDGDTRKLKLKLRMSGSEIPTDYWIQLDEQLQEIYALYVYLWSPPY